MSFSPTNTALITTSDIKMYLNIPTHRTEYDSFIELAIAAASNRICRMVNQDVMTHTNVTILNGTGNQLMGIYNADFPIQSLNTLEYRADINEDWTALTSTDFSTVINGQVWKLWAENSFYAGSMNYRVTYTAGYSAIPSEIRMVAIEMVATAFKESDLKGGPHGGILNYQSVSENIAGISTSTNYRNMQAHWRDLLSKFRKVTF